MYLTHRDKVTLRKAFRRYVEADRDADAGYNDPITEHYGAQDVISGAYTKTLHAIDRWAERNAPVLKHAPRRIHQYNGTRYAVERLVTEFRLVKVTKAEHENDAAVDHALTHQMSL